MTTYWNSQFDEYLHDESRKSGYADSISFPASEQEIVETVSHFSDAEVPVTIQGARTGIVAGAVPFGGHILNLSRFNRIESITCSSPDENTITTQPGAILDDIRSAVGQAGLFFPPDPTESTASIGGMVAANASGALSFHYGPTRNWIVGLRAVLANGDILQLRRGECFAQGRSFELKTLSNKTICGELPSYTTPEIKSAAGYYVRENMDLIDLFIGSEGTLGIITSVELKLIPKPKAKTGLAVFLPSEESALKLVRLLRGETGSVPKPVAIEFFDSDALNLIRKMKSDYSAFDKIPALKPNFHTAIYTEFHGESDEELEEAALALMEQAADLGVNDEDTWFATSERELEPLKAFRHAIPEAVNLLIDERKRQCPSLAKLGTDMSVPNDKLETVMELYRKDLRDSGLESVVFGHIGDNHVHVNILPNTQEEYDRGRQLYLDWSSKIVKLGGSVSAEHGIGKSKAPFLKIMFGEQGIEEMRRLRKIFDPKMVLNRGNLFD